jgi:hypothetical protein
MRDHTPRWCRVALLALGCTPSQHPPSAASSADASLVAAVEPAPDGRAQMIGRPWLRQRATLSLHGAEATLALDSESGVADVRCPEELAGTSTEGCGSPAEARALERRVDRAHAEWRGVAETRGGDVRLTLRSGPGVAPMSLRCRWSGGGLDCAAVSGWPVGEGYRSPSAVSFARPR